MNISTRLIFFISYIFAGELENTQTSETSIAVVNDKNAPLIIVKQDQSKLAVVIPEYENTSNDPIKFRVPEGEDKTVLLMCPPQNDDDDLIQESEVNVFLRGSLLLPNGNKDKPCAGEFQPDIKQETTETDKRCYKNDTRELGNVYKVGYWVQGPAFVPLYEICFEPKTGIFYTSHTIHPTKLLEGDSIVPRSDYILFTPHKYYARKVDKECEDSKHVKHQLVPYRDMPIYTWQTTTLFYVNLFALPSELKDHLDKVDEFIRKTVIKEKYSVKVFTAQYAIDATIFYGKILIHGVQKKGIAIVTKYPFNECDQKNENEPDICKDSGWSDITQVDSIKCTYCHQVTTETKTKFGLVFLQEPEEILKIGVSTPGSNDEHWLDLALDWFCGVVKKIYNKLVSKINETSNSDQK